MRTDLSLYIHIPFCVRKCRYCDFLSYTAGREEQKKYLDKLISEIRSEGRKFGDRNVVSVYIGGGTPSVLSAQDIERIMNAVRESFNVEPQAEISMEVNPGTADADKLLACRKAGINRISFGLQSTDDSELRLLGRIHDYRTFLKSYGEARQAGFENINVDLISALPGQDADSYEKSLRRVAELGPEHISAYSLQLEEGTYFFEHRDEYDWPDEELDRQLYSLTERILTEYGYHRYEISNYAVPGCECRHNIVYWQRGNYLGLGLGAASLIDEVRFCNSSDPEVYGNGKHINIEELSEKDRMEEFMFLGLRLTEGIDPDIFSMTFGKDIYSVYGEQLAQFEKEGLLVRKPKIRLTAYGLDVSNYVFTGFLFDDDRGAD